MASYEVHQLRIVDQFMDEVGTRMFVGDSTTTVVSEVGLGLWAGGGNRAHGVVCFDCWWDRDGRHPTHNIEPFAQVMETTSRTFLGEHAYSHILLAENTERFAKTLRSSFPRGIRTIHLIFQPNPLDRTALSPMFNSFMGLVVSIMKEDHDTELVYKVLGEEVDATCVCVEDGVLNRDTTLGGLVMQTFNPDRLDALEVHAPSALEVSVRSVDGTVLLPIRSTPEGVHYFGYAFHATVQRLFVNVTLMDGMHDAAVDVYVNRVLVSPDETHAHVLHSSDGIGAVVKFGSLGKLAALAWFNERRRWFRKLSERAEMRSCDQVLEMLRMATSEESRDATAIISDVGAVLSGRKHLPDLDDTHPLLTMANRFREVLMKWDCELTNSSRIPSDLRSHLSRGVASLLAKVTELVGKITPSPASGGGRVDDDISSCGSSPELGFAPHPIARTTSTWLSCPPTLSLRPKRR